MSCVTLPWNWYPLLPIIRKWNPFFVVINKQVLQTYTNNGITSSWMKKYGQFSYFCTLSYNQKVDELLTYCRSSTSNHLHLRTLVLNIQIIKWKAKWKRECEYVFLTVGGHNLHVIEMVLVGSHDNVGSSQIGNIYTVIPPSSHLLYSPHSPHSSSSYPSNWHIPYWGTLPSWGWERWWCPSFPILQLTEYNKMSTFHHQRVRILGTIVSSECIVVKSDWF